jgi:predicted nucleic acid-binding protein
MLAVVCDASPLIYLSKLEQFQLLRLLYRPVLVPPAVWEEVAVAGQGRPESTNLRTAVEDAWILIDKPTIERGRL